MDWLASVFSVAGLYLSSRKIWWCWPAWTASNLFWIVYGLQTRQWSIVSVDVVMVIQSVYGWVKWNAAVKTRL